MALHAAEEESIEALKTWWEENYRMLVSVIVAVTVGWGGWTFWQSSSTSASNAASDRYEEILQLALVEPGMEITAENAERIAQLAASLRADYPRTIYARYSALFAAQQAVNLGDLETAEQELQWLLDNNSGGLFQATDATLTLTANLRLGRVILARGDAERALDLVNRVNPGLLEADFAELRGDIYLFLDRRIDAYDSYLAAQQAGSTSQFLRMKLDELAGDS
ncbi:MAG: tetratricopeptide repeat protein [Pseudohongiellaceae bacterium]